MLSGAAPRAGHATKTSRLRKCVCRYGQARFRPSGLVPFIAPAHHHPAIVGHVARRAGRDSGTATTPSSTTKAARSVGLLHSTDQVDPAAELWIITEADRSATTLLRPDDY